MDLTRDCIEKLQEMDVPHTVTHGENMYVDKHMTQLNQEKTAEPLSTETLTSIVDYIKNDTDGSNVGVGKFIAHISGFNCVKLCKELNRDKNRDCLISAQFESEQFEFSHFMDLEQFIIGVQAAFVQDENTAKLLEFVSSVRSDSGVAQNDDGVGQTVTATAGISLAKRVTAPNPITLRPFRTFAEIEQPESNFVFRLRKSDNGVMAALFPADGDHWKHTAITSIAEYFKSELSDSNVIVLA